MGCRTMEQRVTLFHWADLIGLPIIVAGEVLYYVVEVKAHELQSLSPEEIVHSPEPERE